MESLQYLSNQQYLTRKKILPGKLDDKEDICLLSILRAQANEPIFSVLFRVH